MTRIVIPQKSALATIPVIFDFASQMVINADTITSAAVTCTVFSGMDANPSDMIENPTVIEGTQAIIFIQGGVTGVIYIITCIATMSSGLYLEQWGYLAILPGCV